MSIIKNWERGENESEGFFSCVLLPSSSGEALDLWSVAHRRIWGSLVVCGYKAINTRQRAVPTVLFQIYTSDVCRVLSVSTPKNIEHFVMEIC